MNKLLWAALLSATVACTSVAAPQSALPAAVQKEINSDAQTCRGMGGRFSYADAVLKADLNHDGHLDYVYDASLASCANAPDLGGSGGWQVTVFAGQADGKAKQVFSHGAVGAGIINGRLYLGVGGELCGTPTKGKARAEYQNCIRPLAWNARKQVFEFAPVSQKKPFPKSWER